MCAMVLIGAFKLKTDKCLGAVHLGAVYAMHACPQNGCLRLLCLPT
jgi:hypothetical protein